MNKLFLIYRSTDTGATIAVAQRIRVHLERQLGKNSLIQLNTLSSDVGIQIYVDTMVKQAAGELVIIGPRWLENIDNPGRRQLDDPEDMIQRAIEMALTNNIPIVPILVDHAFMPDQAYLPDKMYNFQYLNALTVRDDPDFYSDIKRVIKTSKKLIALSRKRQKRFILSLPFSIAVTLIILSSIIFSIWHASLSFSNAVMPLPSHSASSSISEQITNDRLEDIVMLSPTNGWAVGDLGTILHFDTSRWIRVQSPTTVLLTNVVMLSANEGWAVGVDGTILHYLGGKWALVPSPTTQTLYGIGMVSSNEGWAMGEEGTILHYLGGEWRLFDSPASEMLVTPVMLSTNNGWAVGRHGTILHYDGMKWVLVPSPDHNALLTDLFMLSDEEGWAVGWDEQSNKGIIFHFDNEGWTIVPSPTSQWLGGITMLSSSDGWIVGFAGTILHYNGKSWIQVHSPTTVFLASVAMVTSNDGWAVGWNDTANTGAILHYDAGIWSNYVS